MPKWNLVDLLYEGVTSYNERRAGMFGAMPDSDNTIQQIGAKH